MPMINSKSRLGVIYRKARQSITYRSNLSCTLVAFLVGILVGGRQQPNHCGTNGTTSTNAQHKPQHKQHTDNAIVTGSFHRLSDIPMRTTSHKGVMKQQLLDPFVVPRVAGFSVATIHPGQAVEMHQHESMHEFFYVTKGTGTFIIENKEVNVAPGDFLHIAPHERHAIRVGKPNNNNDDEDDNAKEGMQVIFFGVTLD